MQLETAECFDVPVCGPQVAFFLLGLCYGVTTFKHAGQIHLEAYYAMPKGECRRLVAWMAVVSCWETYCFDNQTAGAWAYWGGGDLSLSTLPTQVQTL